MFFYRKTKLRMNLSVRRFFFGEVIFYQSVRHMQTADLQTRTLYVVLPLPSLIANLNNLTEVLGGGGTPENFG